LQEALYKGLIAAGYKMDEKARTGVFITVRDADKPEIYHIAEKFAALGFKLYSTAGTAALLRDGGLKVLPVGKISEGDGTDALSLLSGGKLQFVISTSAKGRNPARDSVKIRRQACQLGIPCLTSLDTANAVADSILSGYGQFSTELVHKRHEKRALEAALYQNAGLRQRLYLYKLPQFRADFARIAVGLFIGQTLRHRRRRRYIDMPLNRRGCAYAYVQSGRQ
jgi:carbamoyl-phosphate synthase large subunit